MHNGAGGETPDKFPTRRRPIKLSALIFRPG